MVIVSSFSEYLSWIETCGRVFQKLILPFQKATGLDVFAVGGGCWLVVTRCKHSWRASWYARLHPGTTSRLPSGEIGGGEGWVWRRWVPEDEADLPTRETWQPRPDTAPDCVSFIHSLLLEPVIYDLSILRCHRQQQSCSFVTLLSINATQVNSRNEHKPPNKQAPFRCEIGRFLTTVNATVSRKIPSAKKPKFMKFHLEAPKWAKIHQMSTDLLIIHKLFNHQPTEGGESTNLIPRVVGWNNEIWTLLFPHKFFEVDWY